MTNDMTAPMLRLALEGQLFVVEAQLGMLRQAPIDQTDQQWTQFGARAFAQIQELAAAFTSAAPDNPCAAWVSSAVKTWLRSLESLSNIPHTPPRDCNFCLEWLESYAELLRDMIQRLSSGKVPGRADAA